MKFIKWLDIPIEDIEDNPFYPRRFEEFDTEDIKRMTKSFEKSGLLNAIIVREIKREINNEKIKYQMIAGERRKRAYQLTGKKTILARIVDADDIEVQIVSLIENYHRKDLTVSEKENYIYKLWNNGNEKGFFHNNLSIMEDWTGVPHQVLSDIINAGKEKEKDESEVIQLATSKDLQRTRALNNIPEIRKLLLEGAVIKKTIKALELENLVKVIKKGKEDDIQNNILYGIVELAVDQKIIIRDMKNIIEFIIVLNKEDQQNIIEKLKRDSKSVDEKKLNIFEFKNFVDTYAESSDDVKQKLLYNNISIKEAKELNKFKARDQREKVLTDLKLYDNKIRDIEKEKYRYLQKRTQQAKDLEEKEDLFNLDEEDLDKKKFKVPEEDELKLVDKIVKIKKELLYFDIERIDTLNNSTNRNFAIEFLWEIYNRFHGILVDLGEITADYNIKQEYKEEFEDYNEEESKENYSKKEDSNEEESKENYSKKEDSNEEESKENYSKKEDSNEEESKENYSKKEDSNEE